MKHIFYLLIAVVFLPDCSPPEKEQEGQIMEYAGEEDNTEEDEPAPENESDEEEFETKWTQVVEANIGTSGELAIMILKEQAQNEEGLIEITGYYFYVAHQKNLDLKGTKDPKTGKYILTESYKGKTSGYMEFITGKPDQSFWAPSKGGEKQDMSAKNLTGGDPYEMTLTLNHGNYIYEHEVTMMTGEENWNNTDELKVTFINDDYMAFDINVVRTNAHLGAVSGIARVSEDKARYLVDEDDEFSICDISFDLSQKNEITVVENNCTIWHGAYATFDGTYVKK